MAKTFYDQTKLLDLYRDENIPLEDQVNSLIKLIDVEKFARYFFEGLGNPNWINPLYRNGFFLSPPQPVEVRPGYFQLPGWPAGEYLARYANQYENIVADIVKSIKTDNWRVHEILIDCI